MTQHPLTDDEITLICRSKDKALTAAFDMLHAIQRGDNFENFDYALRMAAIAAAINSPSPITSGPVYDYTNQAWMVDGKYNRCGHPPNMSCGCFSRTHAGQTAHFAHTEDRHCTIDPDTQLCIFCGVLHDEECPDCGGRGFHKPTCEVLVTPRELARLKEVANGDRTRIGNTPRCEGCDELLEKCLCGEVQP